MAEGGSGGGYRPRVLQVQDQTCGVESTLSSPFGCSPCPSVEVLVAQFAIPWTVAHQAPLSMAFSTKNTGVGCHALLQGIFPTQGLNPDVSYISCIGSWVLYH